MNELEKTAELLNETQFWNLVEDSLQQSTNQDSQEEYLIDALEKLTPKEIIGFRLRTDQLLYDTYNNTMWCAGYLMNGGCSDDGFEYFRNWVISKGKAVYYKAKKNPDSLIDLKEQAEDDLFDFESFWYVALCAFENKTGEDLYDYIDDDRVEFNEENYPDFDILWQADQPESMQKLCPELFKHFWK